MINDSTPVEYLSPESISELLAEVRLENLELSKLMGPAHRCVK